MKYHIILFCAFLILSANVSAQNQLDIHPPILKSVEHIPFSVIINQNQLFLSCESESLVTPFIRIKKPLLADADLHLPFTITLPKDASHYQLRIELLNDNNQILAQRKGNFGSGNNELILVDITEKGLHLNQHYIVKIYHDLVGLYPCEINRPEFAWKQKKWPVLISSLGVIGVITSETLLRNKQKNSYKVYTDLWKSGANESDAKPSLKTANQAKDNRKALTYGSGALVVGSVIWYIIKRRNVKKRQQRYDRYCKPKSLISLAPEAINSAIGKSPGLKLRYTF